MITNLCADKTSPEINLRLLVVKNTVYDIETGAVVEIDAYLCRKNMPAQDCYICGDTRLSYTLASLRPLPQHCVGELINTLGCRV